MMKIFFGREREKEHRKKKGIWIYLILNQTWNTFLNSMSVQSFHEPESFAEAFNHSCWRDVMQEEINAQEKKNKT